MNAGEVKLDKPSNNTKLSINLKEGTIIVEGDEGFVRFIYQDFKESMSKQVVVQPPPIASIEQPASPMLVEHSAPAKPRKAKKTSLGATNKVSATKYKPQVNSGLILTGLAEFYDAWKPENNFERILIFAIFLRDRLEITPCSADDIFTCFFLLKNKDPIPEAFTQAFRDAKSRTHYIEYQTLAEITITIMGENRYNEQLKAKSESSK